MKSLDQIDIIKLLGCSFATFAMFGALITRDIVTKSVRAPYWHCLMNDP